MMKILKNFTVILMLALTLTACGGSEAADDTALTTPDPYNTEPTATWQDMDGDNVRDTLISFDGYGCATAAYFYDHEGRYTGYRVEAGTMCESAESITGILERFIDENGGI